MILAVDNLQFGYTANPVLQDVTFRLKRGTVSAIMGTNGAGKSTLLKCLNHLLRPDKGAIYLRKENLADLDPNAIARHIGYVPQQHPRTGLSVFDTVLMGRKPFIRWAPGRRDMEIVERSIEQMGLQNVVMRSMDELSGGELQKVIMARALAQQPEILLLDEPTANLDLKSQLEVMNLIQVAARQNEMTVLISIHDVNLALRFAENFLLLKDGVIHTCGDLHKITAEKIREVYGVKVVLGEVEGYPVAIPVGTTDDTAEGTADDASADDATADDAPADDAPNQSGG